MRGERIILAHPGIVGVRGAVRGAPVVVSAYPVGFLPLNIVRFILRIGQWPIVSVILGVNAGKKAQSVRTRCSGCHLISPRAKTAHSPAIMLGRPANPMSQRMILDRHSVPADWKCKLAAVVPNSGALQGEGAVVLSSESDTPLIVLGC